MSENRFLVEFGTHDGNSEITVRLSTGRGFQTKSTETPALTTYLPLVVDAGNINTFMFANARTSGASSPGAGIVRLNNADGDLDYLEDRGIGGFDIDIRQENGTSYPSDFPVRFSGSLDYAEFTSYYTDLVVKDKTSVFRNSQYQPYTYTGNNDGSTIELEGTENDIIGQLKPKGDGQCNNLTPVLVNSGKTIYQISSEPVAEILEVYVGRATGTTLDTVHTSLTSFLADTVTAGQYNVYYGDFTAAAGSNDRGCYVMLGTTPSHAVTVDAISGWKNLITRSERIAVPDWTITSNITVEHNTLNTFDPVGTHTACEITKATGTFESFNRDISVTTGQLYTASIFVKPSTLSIMTMKMDDGVNTTIVHFDLSDSTTTTDTNTQSDTAVLNPTIEAVDNGFYRISMTMDAGASTITLSFYAGQDDVSTAGVMYVWGVQFENRDFVGPYTFTESEPRYNNSIPSICWKILKNSGKTLDTQSVLNANRAFPALAQSWVSGDNITVGQMIDALNNSGMFYLINDIAGKYVIGRLKLPTRSESVKTWTTNEILGGKGKPKINKISSQDPEKGIPIYKVSIGYNENHTVMNRQALTGIADTIGQLAEVSKKFSYEDKEVLSLKTKYPSSVERIKDTKLQYKSDALLQAEYEQWLFGARRNFIEVKIPIELATKSDGSLIVENDVVTIAEKLYRITGKRLRFPSANRSEVAGAVTYQAWGGVDATINDIFTSDFASDFE